VFAIAITLLVVDLKVPDAVDHPMRLLHDLRPKLIGFGVSFAVIGLFWVGHHAMFRRITAVDRRLILLNLLFLGAIAFLPFPTALFSSRTRTTPGAPSSTRSAPARPDCSRPPSGRMPRGDRG
jgi:uncharacterized membrane protein